MPRFVVLEHDSPRGVHWDLMLEDGPALKTWALAAPPGGIDPITAEALPDHRLAYLDYEGPVSGERGSVRRFDGGPYTAEQRGEEEWKLSLFGRTLKGVFLLRRQPHDPSRWRFLRQEAEEE